MNISNYSLYNEKKILFFGQNIDDNHTKLDGVIKFWVYLKVL